MEGTTPSPVYLVRPTEGRRPGLVGRVRVRGSRAVLLSQLRRQPLQETLKCQMPAGTSSPYVTGQGRRWRRAKAGVQTFTEPVGTGHFPRPACLPVCSGTGGPDAAHGGLSLVEAAARFRW